jgi:GT2 family glycosyltransferase
MNRRGRRRGGVDSDDERVNPTELRGSNIRPRVSVVIVSWRRPDYVRSCLEHLALLNSGVDEVFVIDASDDAQTRVVVAAFPWAQHVRFLRGAGHMTTSRNVGLLQATGDIVAFIDDDANVRTGWLRGLLDAFSDPVVGAVSGRTCNGLPGEESEGVEAIGQVLPNGELTGNFAADPGSLIEVSHGIGANMSFRREVLARLGGFRDDFRGTGGVREDTDIFLRVRALGYRVVFSPNAVVDHVAAAHVKGRRFDFRYMFWARHNHALLLARNFGLGSSEFTTSAITEISRAAKASHSNIFRRGARILMGFAGVLTGIAVSLWKARWAPSDPVRRDSTGESVRRHLSRL